MTEGTRAWKQRSQCLKTAGSWGGAGRRTRPREGCIAFLCSVAINERSWERASALSLRKGRVAPAAVPGLAARRRCRLRRRRDRADRAACVSGMLAASFCPAWDGSAIQHQRKLYAFCLPQSLSPLPQRPGGTIDTPAKLLDPPFPPLAGRWESGSGWCSQSPGAGAEWGGGSHDPKTAHLPPPPPPPEGSGTKVLCTSRNHLITSSSGMGPRGPPAQSRGVGRKGTGANPKAASRRRGGGAGPQRLPGHLLPAL